MFTDTERRQCIEQIAMLPGHVQPLVGGLHAVQLTAPALPGEWTVAQIVHHLMDSHIHGYVRMKYIRAEEMPALKAYNQDDWALLPDAMQATVHASLQVLEGLHARWVAWLHTLTAEDWQRVGEHEENGRVSLEALLQVYAKHGEAHLEQLQRVLAAQQQ